MDWTGLDAYHFVSTPAPERHETGFGATRVAASMLDTLRYARRLKEAGVAPEQAEAMADARAEEFVLSLATKADLGLLGSELKASMAALEARLTWRLLGGITVIVGLAVAFVKLG